LAVPSTPLGLRQIRELRHAYRSRNEHSGISLAMGLISHVRLEKGKMTLHLGIQVKHIAALE
jgi:hypothetical protein